MLAPVPVPVPMTMTEDGPPSSREAPIVPLRPQALAALRVLSVDIDSGRVELEVGSAREPGRLDVTVDPVVVTGAAERGERVIAQHDGQQYVVLGTLRTRATPGIDRGDEYVIEARRVTVRGAHELALVAGESSVVLRALGHIELLSRNITARAAGVQKIIARMIHLN